MNIANTQNLLILGGALFAIGLVGFLTRRSLILLFLSLETMLSGVSINLIAFSRLHLNYQGQILAIMVLTVAACEAAIALALVVSLYRRKATLDVEAWDELSETLVPKEPEDAVPSVHGSALETEPSYPRLVPAGLDPLSSPVPSTLDAAIETASRLNAPQSTEASTRA
ncbi:MAG: NADH-quinone oxidoreductase subunit NuoK [Planctomycetota bacterium]|jgi:NADH-quinone oxidoreductase subunit K